MSIRLACIIVLLIGLFSTGMPVRAGQMAGHTYVALQTRRFLSGPARTAVEANEDAYLSGAQGPDITGVVMPGLDKASAFTSVGKETHYSDKKAELAMNVLDCATTDQERAYALGWMTHYVNDIFIHAVVNDYGGYYAVDDKHHKVLEQLESKHVLTKHAGLITGALSKTVPSTLGGNFGGFLFDAYHKTYPDNPIYQSGKEWLVENRPYFISRYKEATLWCRSANDRFYESHVSGTGEHGWSLAGMPFPDMPSKQAYALMGKAIEITNVEPQAEFIRVTVKVNDNRLYGRFLVDWDAAIESAIQYTNQVFTFASDYLAEKDPAKKAAARKELLEVIPNMNLDQPHVTFDAATMKPGKVNINKVTSVLTLYKKVDAGKPLGAPEILTSLSIPIPFTGKQFAESQVGEVTFNVPVPAGAAPYRFTLQLALSGKEALKVPEYRDVDWTQAEGTYPGTWMSGAGAVMETDIFPVRLPIPDTMVGKPGTRRWVLMPEDADVKEEDLPIIKARLQNEKFRYDIEVLEEKLDGKELTATLQVTDTNPYAPKIAGRCRLVMLWFTDGKADTDVGGALGDLTAQLAEAAKLLEEATALMDNLLTDAQEEKLGAIMAGYDAELTKKGVGEEEKARLMEKRAYEEMKKMGVDLSGLEKINAKIQALEAKGGVPFHVGTSIDLALADMRFDTAAGWKPGENYGNLRTNNTRGASKEVTQKDKDYLQWTLEAGITATLLTNEETVKFIQTRMNGKPVQPLTIAGFTGNSMISNYAGPKDGVHQHEIHGEALLKKGNVYLNITYSALAKGYKHYENDKDNKPVLVYDGTADADKAAESALADITGMYRGIRILPIR